MTSWALRTKNVLKRSLRAAGGLEFADLLRLGAGVLRNALANRQFRQEHPGFAVPPASISFDAYGHVRADRYFETGQQTAAYIASLITEHSPLPPSGVRIILDWGCGAARVVRHLATFLEGDSEISATDYNQRTIDWCRRNIGNVHFFENRLKPPLEFDAETFDCIYGISVLTHLSAPLHLVWRDELLRILKPRGLLILTARGIRNAELDLLKTEKELYDRGECVVQANVPEGRKWFAAYQSPEFMRGRLFAGNEIVGHIERPPLEGFSQDIWIVRK